MMQQQMPPQGGSDIFSEIGALVEQMVQTAGPEAVLAMLKQAGGGQGQMPTDMPPEMMSQGGPGAMPPMAPMPSRGMMGRKIPGN